MIKIDVHIGTRKTGTTSIQHYCKSVREELLKAGTLYPKSLGLPSNNRLATAFQNADKVDGLRRKASVLSPEAVDHIEKMYSQNSVMKLKKHIQIECSFLMNSYHQD